MAVEKLKSKEILIRHDYKKACYRALLSEFTPEEVAEFFDKVPMLLDGRHIKGPELYKLLWSDKAKIPEFWDYTTDNHIERFLIDKGRDIKTMLARILWLNNRSTVIPGRVLLTWFYPKLESLFNSIDTRDMVFSFIALFTENWLPGHVHRPSRSSFRTLPSRKSWTGISNSSPGRKCSMPPSCSACRCSRISG
jgi:hypothetical protein